MSTTINIPHSGAALEALLPVSSAMTREQYASAFDEGYPKTTRYLLSRGLNRETAEEFAQAGWAKGWEYREQLQKPHAVTSWINTIAFNLFRRVVGGRKVFLELLPEDLPVPPAIGPGTVDLARMLANCSTADRDLIEKHYAEGYTSAEIGEQSGCSAVAIRVRLFRLRRKMTTASAQGRRAIPSSKGGLPRSTAAAA